MNRVFHNRDATTEEDQSRVITHLVSAACGEELQMMTTVIEQVHTGEDGVCNGLCRNPRYMFEWASHSATAHVRGVSPKLLG